MSYPTLENYESRGRKEITQGTHTISAIFAGTQSLKIQPAFRQFYGAASENTQQKTLEQWFSTFLMLQPYKTAPQIVVTSNHKSVLFVFHNCNFATVMNQNVNI